MLDAAQRLLADEGGLTVSLETLTLDSVIKEAGVDDHMLGMADIVADLRHELRRK